MDQISIPSQHNKTKMGNISYVQLSSVEDRTAPSLKEVKNPAHYAINKESLMLRASAKQFDAVRWLNAYPAATL